MPARTATGRSTLRTLAALLGIAGAAAAVLAALEAATPGLYGYDGYFHVRYAQVLRSEGVSRTFPWWQETFLRDRYADKDFLYHVLLIPFTFGDLIAGGKAAAVFFGAAAVGIFFLVARRTGAPWPAAWALGLLASSAVFLYRLGFTRPLVVAVALALAGTSAILLGRRREAFAWAAIYPHAHISFHLLPCVALLHDLHGGRRSGGGRRFALSAWTAAGAAAGATLSPFVPNNLRLWWVQNVRVLGMAWGGPEDLRLGLEIQPTGAGQLLQYNAGVFLALAGAVYLMARSRRRASPDALTLLVISAGFLALSMMSRRFIEFWAPFTMLLAAVAARDALGVRSGEAGRGPEVGGAAPPSSGSEPARRPGLAAPARWAAGASIAAAGAALFAYNAGAARRFVAEDPGPTYAGASEWMAANVPAGETVFHLDWDDFPQLFFFNPQLRYLVGLDPTFMYLTSAERWRLWSDVAHTNVEDVYAPIRNDFGCRWVFVPPEGEDFLKAARRDPRFFPRYQDGDAAVFFLADGFAFVSRWRLTGWFADPSRRLFDVPLGPEPGASAVPAAVGPGAEGLDRSLDPGFVDLRRLLAVPDLAEDVCAVAEATLRPPRAGTATLAVTTDDEIRIHVNGKAVLEHSPFRTPPPGLPGGPTASLDEFLESASRVPERAVMVDLAAGPNAVRVKTCQFGAEFGFFLRAYGDDGSPIPEPAGGR